MIGINMYTTILTLHKQGNSERSISKNTNIHRSTIRKIIRKYKDSNIEHPILYKKTSKLEEWNEKIIELLSKKIILD